MAKISPGSSPKDWKQQMDNACIAAKSHAACLPIQYAGDPIAESKNCSVKDVIPTSPVELNDKKYIWPGTTVTLVVSCPAASQSSKPDTPEGSGGTGTTGETGKNKNKTDTTGEASNNKNKTDTTGETGG